MKEALKLSIDNAEKRLLSEQKSVRIILVYVSVN